MYVDRSVAVVVLAVLVLAVSVIAGLIAGILRGWDGATIPAAVRAAGRAGLTVAGVLLAAVSLVVAAWGL
ncbi:hypothetical protein ACG83_40455 [Frankia sp. R43]|uniref:hypothetical protein n=1 Tax=Frankia sp. R43 TaxID=269536 RepID=UPI0006CA08DA|nr:hypothetical protein [Frankia sp. R43]KPM50402.1 hypothetical protein ACG83_40455 [Frankia sp. R43]